MEQTTIDQIRLLKHAGHSYAKIDRLLNLPKGVALAALHPARKASDSQVCEYCGEESRNIHRHTINYITGEFKRACPKCHYLQHHGVSRPPKHVPGQRLSRRERECVDHILAGKKNWETAKLMGISLRTVEKHRMAAYNKLNVSSGIELALAMSKGQT